MTYEQFLKQLKRIGLQMVILGTCGMIIFSVLYFTTSGVLSPVALACLGPSGILIVAGYVIYPVKGEE